VALATGAGACIGALGANTESSGPRRTGKHFGRLWNKALHRGCSPSMAIWRWAGASLCRAPLCLGFIGHGGSRPSTICPSGSISCVYVRKDYRKRGITSALIEAAISTAKAAGAPVLEAYPLDANLTPSASGTGYASTFARAGFKIVGLHTPPRPIMRRDLRTS